MRALRALRNSLVHAGSAQGCPKVSKPSRTSLRWNGDLQTSGGGDVEPLGFEGDLNVRLAFRLNLTHDMSIFDMRR